MADAGDALALLGGGGGEQGAGAAEKKVFPPALGHPVQQVAGQHHGGAAAARAAAVDVLPLQIEDHGAAVVQIFQVHAVPVEEVQYDLLSQLAQIAGDDEIVIGWLPARVGEVGAEGVVGRWGRSQGCTMWKMFSVKFNAYSSPEARRF